MARHIPISEFKDHASELVAAVERGEELVITRHGKPAARLSPARPQEDDRKRLVREIFARFAGIRAEQRALGQTTTIAELIEWKNEGRR